MNGLNFSVFIFLVIKKITILCFRCIISMKKWKEIKKDDVVYMVDFVIMDIYRKRPDIQIHEYKVKDVQPYYDGCNYHLLHSSGVVEIVQTQDCRRLYTPSMELFDMTIEFKTPEASYDFKCGSHYMIYCTDSEAAHCLIDAFYKYYVGLMRTQIIETRQHIRDVRRIYKNIKKG